MGLTRADAVLRALAQGRRGGIFFLHDPSAFQLTLRAEGYAEP